MPILKNVLVPFLSAAMGGAAVVAATHYSPALRGKTVTENSTPRAPRPHEEALSAIPDFFDRAMAEMREDMQNFEPHTWLNEKIQAGPEDISRREDDKYVYYDIKVPDVNATQVNTKIENGNVWISGSTEKKSNGDSAESFYKSNFERSFPVPENVDSDKMEMVPESDKYVLKFPKLKA